MTTNIPVEPRERAGVGGGAPRYELRTRCCAVFLCADDSLDKVLSEAERYTGTRCDYVVYDFGDRVQQ
jgi:hypothetical protein